MTRVRALRRGERRQGLHAPTPRRARSSPTSSATSPRCCRTCRTSGWSMPARTSAARARAGRREPRLRDSRGRLMGAAVLGGISMIRKLLIAVGPAVFATAAHAEWHEATSNNFIVYSEGSAAGRARLRGQARALPLRAAHLPPDHRSDQRRTGCASSCCPSAGAVGRMAGRSSVAGYYVPDARGPDAGRHAARGGNGNGDPRSAAERCADLDPESILLPRIYPPFHVPIFPGRLPDLVQRGLRGILGRDPLPAQRRGRGRRCRPSIASRPSRRSAGCRSSRLLARAQLSARPAAPNVFLLYAEGWLIVRYMFEHPERQRQLQQYLRLINDGTDYAARRAPGLPRSRRASIPSFRLCRPRPVQRRAAAVPDDRRRPDHGPHAPARRAGADRRTRSSSARAIRSARRRNSPTDVRGIAARFPDDPFAIRHGDGDAISGRRQCRRRWPRRTGCSRSSRTMPARSPPRA